jgi:hypothetical protein
MTPLERRYGILMSLYPSGYRHERGPEIMSTLLSASRPGQAWPSAGEALPLIGQATRMRLGVAQAQPLGRLLSAVGPAQLILASLMSILAFFGAEWNPLWGRHVLPGGQAGPFQTIGFIALFCWIAAGVALVLNHSRLTRCLVAVSMVATASLAPISQVFATDRPTVDFLAFLFVLGLPVLISQPEGIKGIDSDRLKLTLIFASLAVAILVALVLVPNWDGSTVNRYGHGPYGLSPSLVFYEVSLPSVAAWLLWPASAAIVASGILYALGRRTLAGGIALSGLPLLVLWLGVPNGSDDWVHLLVGAALAATSILLVALYVVSPHEKAASQTL